MRFIVVASVSDVPELVYRGSLPWRVGVVRVCIVSHRHASSFLPSIRVVMTGALQRAGAACPGVPGLLVLDASTAARKTSLDAFNSQYLPRYSSSAPAILTSAKVSLVLDAPREAVWNLLFATLTDGIQLGLGVRSRC